jgi:hypothetical protein
VRGGSDGFALMMVMMAMLLMSALGAALVLLTTSETLIASSYRSGVQAFYAADAMAERSLDDLQSLDWDLVLSGVVRSPFADGRPSGPRPVAGGGTIDPADAVSLANCGKTTCSSADLAENVTGDRPWAIDNPVWQLFGYGPVTAITGSGNHVPCYVVAMVARSPAAAPRDPVDTLLLRAEAFGPRNSHKVIELAVARSFTEMRGPEDGEGVHDAIADERGSGAGRVRVVSWREIQ